jgi:hypothetical protein
MIGEIGFVEVSAFGQIELAHLAVGKIDAAHLHGDYARAQLEAESRDRSRR